MHRRNYNNEIIPFERKQFNFWNNIADLERDVYNGSIGTTRYIRENNTLYGEDSMKNIYDSQYGNVAYIGEDSTVLLTWKQKCSYDDYRNTTLAALEAMRRYKAVNLVIDARNGFEDEKEDVGWGFRVLLPAMAETSCKKVIMIMETVNDIEEEMDMWTAEFKKYFAVSRVDSYQNAVSAMM